MEAKIEKDKLILEIPLSSNPSVSKSGKSKIIASSGGFVKPGIEYNGKQVSISYNIIIPK